MRICVILEGCYPYVTGGVSSWMHQLIQGMPQHEFVIWAIGADSSQKGKYKYKLPDNVVQVQELFLNDALHMHFENKKYRFAPDEMQQLRQLLSCGTPDWEKLFSMYHERKISPISFLMSEEFMELLTQLCNEEYPYIAFSDFFHTIRSMMLPLLYSLQTEVPKADVYHAIATGYAGVLARLGSYVYNVPYEITEHGIYTREREEEIIRANWVIPAFKRFWVRYFYMLSQGAYEKATMITSLFGRARQMQIEMGCDPHKCEVVPNGVHVDRFAGIGPKEPTGYIDIGAVLRIAPIKDVKTLIYAFSSVKRRVPNARLFIAGPEDDPEYGKECHDLVASLQVQDVIFLGTINVIEWLGKFDFTVLTSISEGQPLAVLESYAAGRPCVTTDVGCCRELLAGEGDDTFGLAGYYAPPMHRQAIADAMVRMCEQNEERIAMGHRARKRVETYFRHPDMVKKYIKVYDEVMRRWQESASV